MAARQWTDEQRARQSAIIQRWQPWRNSTGARTPEGKAVSSKNVLVGQRNKQRALELARQELNAAQAKIRKLTAKRGEWWNK
jgi:hypothetical protein